MVDFCACPYIGCTEGRREEVFGSRVRAGIPSIVLRFEVMYGCLCGFSADLDHFFSLKTQELLPPPVRTMRVFIFGTSDAVIDKGGLSSSRKTGNQKKRVKKRKRKCAWFLFLVVLFVGCCHGSFRLSVLLHAYD